jgi:hypothetical protein
MEVSIQSSSKEDESNGLEENCDDDPMSVSYARRRGLAAVPPPTTTNRTTPRAQRPKGDCFVSFSLWDAFTGFFPARAFALNCSFRWRIEEVDYKVELVREG